VYTISRSVEITAVQSLMGLEQVKVFLITNLTDTTSKTRISPQATKVKGITA
jgi:hypothetical protein